MYYYSDMREALERGNAPRVKALAEHALEEGRSATEILNEGLIAAMSVVGVKFKNNEIYVPEVMVAARAMT
ncbi:MAG: B12-binding domain-containing protein, partial [Firmicutes bacterium]|nr:B12-binding domain-containing protein [Bacillota bacterium]